MFEMIKTKMVVFVNWLMSTRSFAVRAECKLLEPEAQLPSRKRITDAAYDVYSIEDAVVPPHGICNINTGVIVTVPPGYYITVEARSSLGKIGVIPMRGIIDSTYTDKLMVILTNQTEAAYNVHKGDRIAQIVVHRQIHLVCDVVPTFSKEYSTRGTLGWGSSGK